MSNITNSIKDFRMEINQDFIDKAEKLKPILIEKLIKPKQIVNIKMGKNDWEVIDTKSIDEISNISLGKGESICIDFGNHQVGYVNFKIKPIGSPPDAPTHLRIKLGETLCEIGEDSSTYKGSISSSWIQEETMHIDILPDKINMKRRYAFRYLEIKVLDTSPKYKVIVINGVVYDSDDWWCFLDWKEGLNKQAGAQGVLIYALKQAHKLAIILGDNEKKEELEYEIDRVVQGAKNHLWDEKQGFFVSGSEKQVSWISQIWCVLADVFDKETNTKILDNLLDNPPDMDIVTPYAYHHLVECLILNNRKEKALECIRGYWGEMVKDGADCFWELYNPNDKYVSPYGSRIINSYCHAWSCTPSYFIRKYFGRDSKEVTSKYK
ncbi:sugar hydrolase [Clostridioides difficile]|nr:sugar hydrolase [Clostridioides difficile]